MAERWVASMVWRKVEMRVFLMVGRWVALMV
jgi:hypothetical protein